jgi:hypothetical protein
MPESQSPTLGIRVAAMVPRLAVLLPLLLLALLLFAFPTIAESDRGPQILDVRVGIAGHYKPGLWTPVRVTLAASQEPVEGRVIVTAPDSDGVPSRFSTPPDAPCQLHPGQPTAVTLYARFGRAEGELTVEFEAAGRPPVRRVLRPANGDTGFRPAVASSRPMIVTVGAEPLEIDKALASLQERPGRRALEFAVWDPSDLPERWYGYEGVDLVVLTAGRPEAYAGLRSDSPQIAALDEWIQMGGTLVLSVGRRADALLQPGSALARFAPGRLDRVIPLRQAAALETYAGGGGAPVPRLGAGNRLDLRVPQLTEVQGEVEAREGNLALVVRSTRGFGQIIFSAVDLDDPALRGWRDRGQFLRRLLAAPDRSAETAQEQAAVLHYGYDDMAGQLRSALDQFPEVPLAPFSLVAGLVVGYLVLIGPVDYFLLRRVVRRMTLTWVTFPLITVAFCAGTYLLVHRLKGDQVRVNQAEVVDIDAASGRLRGTAWANVFSPRAERYDLAFEPQLPADGRADAVLASWLGLPGEGLGGMSPRTSGTIAWKRPYEHAPRLDALEGLPIPAWSTRSLTARWTARTRVPVEAELAEEDQLPTGAIRNGLEFPLQDALLCYRGWAYTVGTIEPGREARVGRLAERRDLRTFLTGRRTIVKDGRQLATPYDRSSTEIAYILRAMMFFETGGGRHYTGLANDYQGFVDSSDLLQTNHAILVAGVEGQCEGPHRGARLLRGGRPLAGPEDRHWTVYRFVFPVAREK